MSCFKNLPVLPSRFKNALSFLPGPSPGEEPWKLGGGEPLGDVRCARSLHRVGMEDIPSER